MSDDSWLSDLTAENDFEWDAEKNRANRTKHGIDFEDATDVFDGTAIFYESKREGENRWLAVGELGNRIVSVIFTRRGETVRIISARRARRHEERAYRHAQMGRPAQGKD